MKKSRYIAIKNRTSDQSGNDVLEIYFLDVIQETYDFWSDTTVSPVQDVINQVNYYNPKKVKCIIDSVGGDAQAGLAIYNFLKNISAKVEVEIIGLAGSIASVIAMAANPGKLRIAKNAFMMIHRAEGIAYGTAEEVQQISDLIAKYDDQIASIYSQRTGKTIDEVKALYANGDYWMTGDEAVAQGFADEVFNETQDVQIAARLSDGQYKNIPATIKAQMKPEQGNQSFFQQQFDDMKKFFTDIVNALKGVKPSADASVTITNQIADAIAQPFEKLGDEIETTITNRVNDAIKGEAFTTAVNNAVTAATKGLTEKVTALESAKTDLETEITNLKGGASQSKKDEGEKPIGSWS